jgi:glycosyltransferase involved in cell wall biosynthesis
LRILQLTKKVPYPIKDGEVIGIINLTIGFAGHGHFVHVLSLNTNKHHFNIAELPAAIAALGKFEAVNIHTDVTVSGALKNLFTNTSYNVERFYSKAFEQLIYNTIVNEPFDFILLEGIYLMRYIDAIKAARRASKHNQDIPIVQRPQNVEYKIWERLAEQDQHPLKRFYLSFLAKRMKAFELKMMNEADVFIPVSQTDLDIFQSHGCNLYSKAIPTGYVFDTLPPIEYSAETNTVAFIGGMDWMPNREGVEWFLDEVWDKVLAEVPDAKFYLAGRNFPEEIKSHKQQGVYIVGEVEDAKQFIQSHAVSIVPLFAGSGMRVKIVEAMAWGRAIISTSIGAESLAYTHQKDILIADTASDFAMPLLLCYRVLKHAKSLAKTHNSLLPKNTIIVKFPPLLLNL